jgi:Uri superfamily endonuclease
MAVEGKKAVERRIGDGTAGEYFYVSSPFKVAAERIERERERERERD